MQSVASLGVMNVGLPARSGSNILDTADLYVTSKVYDSANTRLTDLSGNGNHAVFGAGTDAPKYLPHTGTDYLYCSGLTGEAFQTPDTAALDITGDIVLLVRVNLDSVTPSANQHILTKYDSGTLGAYSLRINTTSGLTFQWVDSGVVANAKTSSPVTSVGITANQDVWLGVSMDVDNGAGDAEIRFYYSLDNTNDYTQVTFTQLGSTQTVGATTSIQNSTEPLMVGARKASNPQSVFEGRIYWAGVFNALIPNSGTLAAEFNPNSGTISADHTTVTNGSFVWTRTLAATGKHFAIVDESKCLLGVDDYLDIADTAILDFGAAQDFTIVGAFRSLDYSDEWSLINKAHSTPVDGWSVASFGGTPVGATSEASVTGAIGLATVPSDGIRCIQLYRRDAGTEASLWINGTEGTPVAVDVSQNASNSLIARIGAIAAGTIIYADMEFMAVAVFRRFLTDDEVLQVGKALGA